MRTGEDHTRTENYPLGSLTAIVSQGEEWSRRATISDDNTEANDQLPETLRFTGACDGRVLRATACRLRRRRL